MRRLSVLVAVLGLGHSAQAQDREPPPSIDNIEAVRISQQEWEPVDAPSTRGWLNAYQSSLGVVRLPTPEDLKWELVPEEQLTESDVLLVDAPESAIDKLATGADFREVLPELLGDESSVISPVLESTGEFKPKEYQVALLLPRGTLAHVFSDGEPITAADVFALNPELVLGVTPASPCEGKCEVEVEPEYVTPEPIDDPDSIPMPDPVVEGTPPEAPTPVLMKAGGARFILTDEDNSLFHFHAEVDTPGYFYQWFLTNDGGQHWSLGSTTGRSIDFELLKDELPPGNYTVKVRVYFWDSRLRRWAYIEVFTNVVILPPDEYVGVIPHDDHCRRPEDLVTFFMDDEDSGNANSRGGWLGNITSDRNTTIRFCRVPGYVFKALSTTNAAYNHYAVLKLGKSCPNGSEEFSRYFDNEDDDNKNWASGPLGPNTSDRNTKLVFCLFRSNAKTMNAMPSLDFSYGVLAAPDFSLRRSTGYVATDDEDDGNKNRLDGPPGVLADAQRLIEPYRGGYHNTRLNLVLVK